jgi:hypothetical protein
LIEKSFDMPLVYRMPTSKRDPSSPVAKRLIALRESMEMNGPQFAAFIGIDYSRWHNFERGLPLSIAVATLLCKKIPGLSLDWLYQGRPEGLSFALAMRLGVIGDNLPARR